MTRTRPCPKHVRLGRLRKAEQFATCARLVFDLADEATDVADACATLAIHAGIAASDTLCCVEFGVYAAGTNHSEAISLLSSVDTGLGRDLATLLTIKTQAGYSHEPTSLAALTRARRAMESLVAAARAA